MKKSGEERKKGKILRGCGMVLLAGVMLVTGCAGENSVLAGQDDDRLSVTPAADMVLEQVASNGKTYSYDWIGEMSEEELDCRTQQEQDQLRSRMKQEGEGEDKIA